MILRDIDPDHDGGCPCFSSPDGRIAGHCWRGSLNCSCEFSAVHFRNPWGRAEAYQIAGYISEAWWTECDVIYEPEDE